MERVTPIVDETIKALAKVEFIPDPIAGVHYSRTTSIVSSAYKRHGKILEFALRESLRESNRHKVWNDQAFKSREKPTLWLVRKISHPADSRVCPMEIPSAPCRST